MTTQEHADEMRVGLYWHCDTRSGRPVVAVFSSLVYVAQKPVASGCRMKWRRQLSCWQSLAGGAGADVGTAVATQEHADEMLVGL